MTDARFVSTAPVFEIDGELAGMLARDLVHLEVEDTTAGLKTFAARFVAHGPKPGRDNEGLLYLDGSLLDFGKRLEVSIGPEADARTIFSGFISGIEADFRERLVPEVGLMAEDRLMSLRMTRRLRTYTKMSDADIAAEIANQHGLTPEVDAEGPTYDVVQQWNMSDLAFLRERAKLLQAEIWLEGETLYFKTRDKRAATDLTLVRGNHLLDVQLRADLAHQRTHVKVSGYDATQRDAIDEEADVAAVQAEVSDGRTGPEILDRAFGERVSYRVRQAPLSDEEARAWARSEMLRRSRGFVSAVGTTDGSPDMVVGTHLNLENTAVPFDGPGYYVTRVRHTYDLRNGYRTHFEAERATVNAP